MRFRLRAPLEPIDALKSASEGTLKWDPLDVHHLAIVSGAADGTPISAHTTRSSDELSTRDQLRRQVTTAE